uniref:Major facilitator superfamily (MFS) profile domain-containing protein n=1 Tax=Globisporangium ultimum (strain ATCC 200006 / CBS 805.95 / DAOM BR144) TaxID=431595 RepID=K3WX80_GLOUD
MVAIDRKGYTAGEQITKRLNALGELRARGCCGGSRWFISVLILTGGAWALSAKQTLVFSYLLSSISKDLPMDTSKKAFVNGSVMLGAFIGSFFLGNLADMYGRKSMLLAAFSMASIGCALCALAPNIEVLAFFRFIAGIGLGGEQPIIGTLILELAPENVRGRMLVYMDAFWAIGSILALVFAYELEPYIGWRYVLATNAGFLLYAAVLQLYVPESPKWLATMGRFDEAVRVLRSIEHSCSIFHDVEMDDNILNGGDAPPGQLRLLTMGQNSSSTSTSNGSELGASQMMFVPARQPTFFKLLVDRFRILFRYPYFSRTMVLWVVCTGMSLTYYGLDIFLLDHLRDSIALIADANLVIYGSAVAQIPGYIVAAWLVERLGRRMTLIVFLVGACLGTLFEAYITRTTTGLLMSGCVRTFFFMGAWGALYAYVPEHYPITIRVMGSAYAWGISRIGAFLGPYLVIWMSEQWNFHLATIAWCACAVLFVVIVALLFFGVETAGKQIDEAERARRISDVNHTSTPSYTILEDPLRGRSISV